MLNNMRGKDRKVQMVECHVISDQWKQINATQDKCYPWEHNDKKSGVNRGSYIL